MAILILIYKTKAHNFNFHSVKSYCLSTTKIFLPFSLGHYHTIAKHQNFPSHTTAHFFISPTAPRHRPLVKSQTEASKIFSEQSTNLIAHHRANNFLSRLRKVYLRDYSSALN